MSTANYYPAGALPTTGWQYAIGHRSEYRDDMDMSDFRGYHLDAPDMMPAGGCEQLFGKRLPVQMVVWR